MMTKIFMLIMVSFVFLLGTNASASDIEKGFLKYTWGDSASRYSGLSELGNKGRNSRFGRVLGKYAHKPDKSAAV